MSARDTGERRLFPRCALGRDRARSCPAASGEIATCTTGSFRTCERLATRRSRSISYRRPRRGVCEPAPPCTPVGKYLWWSVSMRRRSRGRSRRSGGRRAGGACGRVARRRTASRALEARVAASSELAEQLAEQERAVALTRSAAAEVEAPRGPARAHRGTATARRGESAARSSLIGAAQPPRWSSPWPSAVSGARFGHLAEQLPRRPRADRTCRPAPGRGDADQDVLGMADRARRHRASPPRRGTLLRGVAAKRRRRARPDRDVQRGPERHAVGGRVAGGLHDADRHARAGRRRPGLVGREGARRNGDTGG